MTDFSRTARELITSYADIVPKLPYHNLQHVEAILNMGLEHPTKVATAFKNNYRVAS